MSISRLNFDDVKTKFNFAKQNFWDQNRRETDVLWSFWFNKRANHRTWMVHVCQESRFNWCSVTWTQLTKADVLVHFISSFIRLNLLINHAMNENSDDIEFVQVIWSCCYCQTQSHNINQFLSINRVLRDFALVAFYILSWFNHLNRLVCYRTVSIREFTPSVIICTKKSVHFLVHKSSW